MCLLFTKTVLVLLRSGFMSPTSTKFLLFNIGGNHWSKAWCQDYCSFHHCLGLTAYNRAGIIRKSDCIYLDDFCLLQRQQQAAWTTKWGMPINRINIDESMSQEMLEFYSFIGKLSLFLYRLVCEAARSNSIPLWLRSHYFCTHWWKRAPGADRIQFP